MSPKTSFWLLLRLAVLLAACLVQYGEGATYRDFQNRHIDYPKTGAPNPNAYCNLMMQRRGMTRHSCKRINTFINDPPDDIIDICGRGGTWLHDNIYQSRRPFTVVDCNHTGGDPPNCQYRGRQEMRRICVACDGGRPVHFQRCPR